METHPQGYNGPSAFAAAAPSPASTKQGSYGKVPINVHSIVGQLMHPSEVAAAIQFKLLLRNNVQTSLLDGLSPEYLREHRLTEEDVLFCDKMLHSVSRSFAQVIAQLPNDAHVPLRLAIGVFYLVLRALDTVEDDMELFKFKQFIEDDEGSLPRGNGAFVDEKEQMLLDAKVSLLANFYKHFIRHEKDTSENVQPGLNVDPSKPRIGAGDEALLLEKLDSLKRCLFALPQGAQNIVTDITKEMGIGMSEYVERDLKQGTRDQDDFHRYCHIVAGTVGDGLTRLFVEFKYEDESLVQRKDLWDNMGIFLQRTNIIRDFLEDYVDQRAFWPENCWSKYSKTYGGLLKSNNKMECLNEMVADTLKLVPSVIEYLDSINTPSVLKFCAVPQVMAIATLNELYSNRKVFTSVVKIRKGLAAKMMLELMHENDVKALRLNYRKWFASQIRQIMSKSTPSEEPTREICRGILKLLRQEQDQAIMLPDMFHRLNSLAGILFVLSCLHLLGFNMVRDSVLVGQPYLFFSQDESITVPVIIAFLCCATLLAFAGVNLVLRA